MKTLTIRDYGLNVELTPLINIIGMPRSGKTTMLRLLINQIPNNTVFLDKQNINAFDLNFKRKNIAACFDLKFNTAAAQTEMLYYQNKCGISEQVSFDNLASFIHVFALESLITEPLAKLIIKDLAYIKILSLLIIKPRILGIDNLMTLLSPKQKSKIIKYAEDNNITILNVTTNSEELLLGTDIVILDKFGVKVYDKTKVILADEKLLKSVNMSLPFVLRISDGLKHYDLLAKNYFELSSLVGALWK